jgi:protein TonB
MSHAPHNRPVSESDEGGLFRSPAVKWIAGAAALVVLAGGGYYAWRTYGSSQPDPAPAFAAAPASQPLSEDEAFQADIASTEAFDAEPVQTAAPAPPPRRAPRTEPAEEIIGVTPASVTTTSTESDEIVVPGRRRPNWSRVPSARRLSAMYPARALERGREGEASLRCLVEENGALDCARVSETPENAGFGVAALRVARTFRHAPERSDGSDATGTPINLRVLFRLEEDRRRR